MTEPTLATELEDRASHRDTIAALFKLHPLEDISAETLKAITPHYQQRISQCRRKLGMTIQNIVQSREDASGKAHRLDGSYRYLPDGEPLGRDAGALEPAGWPTVHGRPFEEPFQLKG